MQISAYRNTRPTVRRLCPPPNAPLPAETGYTASILFPSIYSEFASNCIIFSLQVVAKGPLVCSVATCHYRKQTVTPDSLKTLTIQTLEHYCHSCRRHKSTSFSRRAGAAKPEDESYNRVPISQMCEDVLLSPVQTHNNCTFTVHSFYFPLNTIYNALYLGSELLAVRVLR